MTERAADSAELAAMTQRAEEAERKLAVLEMHGSAEFLQLATDELRRSERVLRAIFSGASDAMLLLDDEGRFVDANPAASALLLMNKASLLRRGVGDFADADPEASRAMFARLKEQGQIESRGYLRRATGERRAVDMLAMADIGAGLHMVVLRDTTEVAAAAESLARTEEELRRTDARFRAMVEKSAEAVALLSRDGRVLYMTKHSQEFFGVSPEEIVGESAFARIYRDDEDLLREALSSASPTGATVEFRIHDRTGTLRWLEAIVSNFLDDPAIGALVLNIRDVTGRRHQARERERLIESLDFERRRLGSLLEGAPSFMAVLRGRELVIELANEAYLQLVGRNELVGKKMREAVPEFEEQGFVAILDRVLESGEPFVAKGLAVNVLPVGRSAETRFINATVQALVESDGRRSGVFLHGVNVTEETVAQRRIRAQFNGVPVPTYAFQRVERGGTTDFVLFDFNEAASAYSTGRISGLLGRPLRELFSGDETIFSDVARCVQTGETFQRELERPMLAFAAPRRIVITYSAAPPDLVLAHAEDVTDRRKLEEQLRQAQKMEAVGRLAGGVAHDFNNLLSVVLSYTSLALDELPEGDPIRDDLKEVKHAGDRAVELTRQLLAFSRQQVLQPRTMSIRETVRGLERMLRRLLGEDIELVFDMSSSALVEADPGQIEQVIMNLVINARDAMPEGGCLTVETADIARGEPLITESTTVAAVPYVSLSVRDTGSGMDAATRARIFEPFFTTKGAGKGTGLGLATVFGIVQQSGGTISVDSRPGETSFRIYLPQAAAQAKATVSQTPKVRGAHGGSETVLVVEDEAPLRALTVTVLRRAGYDVLEASDGEHALKVAAECPRPIDLLITDVVMPRVNGRSLSDRLTATRPALRTLFVSGYTDDAAVLQRVLASRVAFLQKPLTPDVLLRKTREVLDEDRLPSSR